MNPIFYKSLSNLDINSMIKDPNFKGCFMRDELDKPNKDETGILNLDTSDNNGTHWTCWIKKGELILYFDSYGLSPPLEMIDYFKKDKSYKGMYYSNMIIQPDNTVICGHLCVFIINSKPKTLKDFICLINYLL